MEKSRPLAEKTDKRSLKTKRAIKDAFIRLMSEKDISQITIKELALTADINRKTFYAHYNDVYDILDDIEDDLTKKVMGIFSRFDLVENNYNLFSVFEEVTAEISHDLSFYKDLFSSTSYSNFLTKMKVLFTEKLFCFLSKQGTIDPDTLAYSIDFIAAGVISTYQKWFNSDRTIPLESLSQIIGSLILTGITPVIENAVTEKS